MYDDIVEIIRKNILLLNIREPFVSNLIYTLTLIVAGDETGVETAGVDTENRLIFNANFVKRIKEKDIEFTILHELDHIIRNHANRQYIYAKSRSKIYKISDDSLAFLYNIVSDAFVNNDVMNNMFEKHEPEVIKPVTFELLSKISGLDIDSLKKMSEEDICDYFIENKKVKVQENKIIFGNNEFEFEYRDIYKSERIDKNCKNCRKFNKGIEGSGSTIRRIIRDAIESAKNAGNFPAGLYRSIYDVIYSDEDWIAILKSALASSITLDVYKNVHKVSRRYPMLPGYSLSRKPELYALLDTSGSITYSELSMFVSAIYTIIYQYSLTTHIYCWDGDVYEELKAKTPDELIEIAKDKIKGGGGTVPNNALIKVYEDHVNQGSDILVIFTDGDWLIEDKNEYEYAIDNVLRSFSLSILVTTDTIPEYTDRFIIIKKTTQIGL